MSFHTIGDQKHKMKISNQINIDKSTKGLFVYLHESAWQGCGILRGCTPIQ